MSTKIRSKPEDLVSFRKKHGLSQTKLAQELGVSRVTVWRWETGRSSIPVIMPIALRGLRHIFESRKSSLRRAERLRLIRQQDKDIQRAKAIERVPQHVRDALNIRDEI